MTNPSYTDEQVLDAASRMEKLADPVRHLGDETGWMTDDVAKMLRQLHAKCQRLQAEVEAKDARLELALRAIEHAETVMSYCSGDAWERECTEADRDAFDDLYKQLFPRELVATSSMSWANEPSKPSPRVKCPECGKPCRGDIGVRAHIEHVHSVRATPNETKEAKS